MILRPSHTRKMSELLEALQDQGEEGTWDFSRLPQQSQFLTTTNPFVMLSGGFGSGKTTTLCAKVLQIMLGIPGSLGYLGRADGKALRASTLVSLLEMLPTKYYTKNDQQGFLRVHEAYGGSKLIYGDLKDINDLKNINLNFFAIDQCEEVSEQAWDYLVGRLRRRIPILNDEGKRQYRVKGECPRVEGSDSRHLACQGDMVCRLCGMTIPPYSERRIPPDIVPPWDMVCYPRFGMGVCNPEGPSHWIFKTFPGLPTEDKEGRRTYSTSELKGYEGIHVDIYDSLNAGFIDGDYVRSLETKYASNAVLAQRYLHGVWVEAEGLVFPSFNRSLHIIPRGSRRFDDQPLLVGEGLTLYEAVDHGTTSPTACIWVLFEMCPCGCARQNLYIIDEHYEPGKPVSFHAACIKSRRAQIGLPIASTYLDSTAFSKTLMGKSGHAYDDKLFSVADEYSEYGITCVPNQKDWDVGYNRITEALQVDPEHVCQVTGTRAAPHLYVSSHCTNTIMEFERYKWKKKLHGDSKGTYGDEPVDREDHVMDALNGLLASRPWVGQLRVPEAKVDEYWDFDMDADIPSNMTL